MKNVLKFGCYGVINEFVVSLFRFFILFFVFIFHFSRCFLLHTHSLEILQHTANTSYEEK